VVDRHSPKTDGTDFIDWDAGREGYSQHRPAGVNVVHGKRGSIATDKNLASIRREENLGFVVAAAGLIWCVYVATQDYTTLLHFELMHPGPKEILALGILAWIHAKWRRSLL